MERVGKSIKFENGYSICKIKCYDGYQMQISYGIFDANDKLYRSCETYKDALRLVSKASIKIEDFLEDEYITSFGEDIERDYYIKSKVDDYRICITYIDAITEDGEEFIEGSAMAVISVNEIRHHQPEFLKRIAEKVDMEWEFEDETIMNTIPEIRSSINCYDTTDYDSTEDTIKQIIETILEFEKEVD